MKILLAATAVVMFTAAMVYAVDGMTLREGLWSIHTQTVNNPGGRKSEGTRSMCRNHAYDEGVRAMAKNARPNCKVISDNLAGGTLTSETECTIGGSVIRTQAKTTISGETSSHSETHTTYTPAFSGMAESTLIMDQKYVGACPAGMEPGDLMDADGKITHRKK